MDTSTGHMPRAGDEKYHASEQQYSELDAVCERRPRCIEVRNQVVGCDRKIPEPPDRGQTRAPDDA
jgi:hypothetical protein